MEPAGLGNDLENFDGTYEPAVVTEPNSFVENGYRSNPSSNEDELGMEEAPVVVTMDPEDVRPNPSFLKSITEEGSLPSETDRQDSLIQRTTSLTQEAIYH